MIKWRTVEYKQIRVENVSMLHITHTSKGKFIRKDQQQQRTDGLRKNTNGKESDDDDDIRCCRFGFVWKIARYF